MRLAAVILALLLLVGCSVNMGIGFRKTPWVVQPKPVSENTAAPKAVVMGLTPEQIAIFKTLLDMLNLDKLVELAPYTLRENEQATFGIWYDGEIY